MKKRALDSNDTEVIRNLQENLLLIRTALGWTTEGLGYEVGLTKQTISHLETKSTDMTKTQYLAITAAIDVELARRNDPALTMKIYHILGEAENKDAAILASMVTAGASMAAGVTLLPGVAAGLTGIALLKRFTKVKKSRKNGKDSNQDC